MIALAAPRGSAARMMGRPMTMWSTPALIASPGVSVRFWSPLALPAGLIPGVTITMPLPMAWRTIPASAAW
jgi:hypothetical protein